MADIGSNLKNIWMKGMEAIGNTASSIASNTRFKVDEMNLVNRRTEILKEFGAQAYALWQKGAHFPEELEQRLQELGKLDEKLNDMRAERFAGVQTETPAVDETEKDEAAEEAAKTPEKDEASDANTNMGEGTISEEPADEEDSEAETVPANDPVPVIRVEPAAEPDRESTPLSSAISDLFEKAPSGAEAADKVNAALDSLEDGLQQFSDSLDEKIESLTEKITGNEGE